jgi:alanine racemase
MTASYRCWAEVDVPSLRANIRTIRSMAVHHVRVIVVVKADAYGHGLSEIAPRLEGDVDLFGVANLVEAQTIRATGALAPILILSPALPEERQMIVNEKFIPTISTVQEALAYARCVPLPERLDVHFVVDTGMGRIGLDEVEAGKTLEAISGMGAIRVIAISSHLPVADEDREYTVAQLERFHAASKGFGSGFGDVTILNSAGVIRFGKQCRPGELVRVGLAVYGISPLSEFQCYFRPALTLKARVTLVRTLGIGRSVSYGRTFIARARMRVATLSAGYGDGINRHLSGKGYDVLIQGRRCPMLGRVTMDQIMVDVSHLDNVEPGDEVVLIGRQGNEEILASEVASKAGTIAWEIFTGITKRVTRLYIE